jgi:hypothetical protein
MDAEWRGRPPVTHTIVIQQTFHTDFAISASIRLGNHLCWFAEEILHGIS